MYCHFPSPTDQLLNPSLLHEFVDLLQETHGHRYTQKGTNKFAQNIFVWIKIKPLDFKYHIRDKKNCIEIDYNLLRIPMQQMANLYQLVSTERIARAPRQGHALKIKLFFYIFKF